MNSCRLYNMSLQKQKDIKTYLRQIQMHFSFFHLWIQFEFFVLIILNP